MKDILFRGKVHESEPMDHPILTPGDWVYGGCVVVGGQPYILCESGLYDVVCPTGGVELVKVDPDTLGEYTGMDDASECKIFEGDIVKSGKTFFGAVEYDADYCRFLAVNGEIYDILRKESEVVGNIYDSPDFLTVSHAADSQKPSE